MPIFFKKGHKINLGRKHTRKAKKKMSKARLRLKKKQGYLLSLETRKKISEFRKGKPGYMLGKKHTEETKRKISEALKGERCHFWKGGITTKNQQIRNSLEYKIWRRAVFERDNWTCIWCEVKSGKGKKVTLHADHIKPFCDYPELRFAIDNGRTLCIDCHKTTESYLKRWPQSP